MNTVDYLYDRKKTFVATLKNGLVLRAQSYFYILSGPQAVKTNSLTKNCNTNTLRTKLVI